MAKGRQRAATARMSVVNGAEGPREYATLVAKLEGPGAKRSSADNLRRQVASDDRVPADEALFQAPNERTHGAKHQKCATCQHYRREGQRQQGKCAAVHPTGKPHRLLDVKAGGYCMLWSPMHKSAIVPLDRLRYRGRARTVQPARMTTLEALAKKLPYSTLPVTAPIHGSSPRWETPPVPDYQEIYFQPESDKRNKLEREHQHTRRRATAVRNSGVYSFHGTALQTKPELHYVPDKTLSGVKTVAGRSDVTERPPVGPKPPTLERTKVGQTAQGSMYGSDDEDEGDEDDEKRKARMERRLKRMRARRGEAKLTVRRSL